MPTRRSFVSSMLGAGVSLPVMRAVRVPPALPRRADRRRPGRGRGGRGRDVLARDPARVRSRPHDDQPEQRRLQPGADARARADDPRSAVLERAAGGAHVARARAAHRVRAARPRDGVRLRPGGDGDHAQRVRGERDDDLRSRPQARRRGRLHDAELSAHAERVAPARAARRRRAQAREDRDAGQEHEVVRRSDRRRDHAAHAG